MHGLGLGLGPLIFQREIRGMQRGRGGGGEGKIKSITNDNEVSLHVHGVCLRLDVEGGGNVNEIMRYYHMGSGLDGRLVVPLGRLKKP